MDNKWKDKWKNIIGACAVAVVLVIGTTIVGKTAISEIAGLAVAQTNTLWNSVVDAAKGDGLTTGIMAQSPYLFNGLTFDRARGSIANGMLVQQTPSGTTAFSVKRDNIAAASVNLAFGFTSKKIAVRADVTNTDEICVNWIGGTATCPAANTSGNGRLKAGTTFILDDYGQTSLSVIAASGTQIIYIDAWN